MQLLNSLSTRGKITLGGCVLAVLLATVLLFKMATAPSYTEVMAGIDPAQTGKVTQTLDAKGIGYELRSNGTAIAVQSGQVAQARIALAESGVGSAAKQPGFELLDKQKLGASNFQQQIAYQRALEGQIANTIGQIQGVGGAQVSLTLPKQDLFADDTQAATAAVMLQGDASSLEPGAIKGIANLVASSVQGLKSDKVTITDATGALLWPQGDGTDGAAGGLSKQAAQARYDAQVQAQLNAMLAQTVGPGKAQVQVHSDLNVDKATQESLTYAKKGVPLKATTETESLQGNGSSGGGAAGTASNIPGYAQAASGGGKSNYRHKTDTTEYGVDKTVTRKTIAPGAVNRLDVALVVDKSVPPATVAQLKSAVASAAGVQTARGDTLAVSQVAFAKPAAAPKAGPLPAGVMGYAKGALLGLAALLLIFFLTRALKKREADPFADEPSWLRGLHAAQLPAGPRGDDEATAALDVFDPQAAAREVFANDPKAIALEDLVQREPEKVAHQLRTWITEDGGS
jgi:flagellar M-ring protein FliF